MNGSLRIECIIHCMYLTAESTYVFRYISLLLENFTTVFKAK